MKKAYEIGSDNLILDGHPQDVRNIIVDVSGKATDGTVNRGQVIDLTDNVYKEHAEAGDVNCIVAESVEYKATDSSVVVPCYITGSFRKSALSTEVELTDTDVERFRELGIILG